MVLMKASPPLDFLSENQNEPSCPLYFALSFALNCVPGDRRE